MFSFILSFKFTKSYIVYYYSTNEGKTSSRKTATQYLPHRCEPLLAGWFVGTNERRTNDERTTNVERRRTKTNDERRTSNVQRPTKTNEDERRTSNVERRTKTNEDERRRTTHHLPPAPRATARGVDRGWNDDGTTQHPPPCLRAPARRVDRGC
jgi:hypothetical protein